MKDNGQGFLFLQKGLYWFKFLLKRKRRLAKIAVFQIHVNHFLFYQNIIFWKILLQQRFICWILLDFHLHLVYFIMQNYTVTGEWDEADWLNALILLIAMLKLPLAVTKIAIVAKIAILAILAMALGIINMAIMGIQLESM